MTQPRPAASVSTSTTRFELQPFFLPGSAGDLFSLYFAPRTERSKGRAVLVCPPFAEEMNKARRMVALQARRFAADGFGVLLVDLYGTGDSAGDFADARWAIWRDDLLRAARWLFEQGYARITLWGLRVGAILAADVARELGAGVERLLFWQPVARGEQMMTQFLRLRLAADLITDGEKITTQQLREALYRGEPVEVAGYTVAPELARAIDATDLQSLVTAGSPPVDWIEITPTARALTPVARNIVDAWRAAAVAVRAEALVGESFWNTPEIALVPELITRTSAWMEGL